MSTELVRTTTRDELRLDGALFTPSASPELNLNAVLLLHGVGGNFYSGSLFELLSAPLLDLGISVLRVNTRGHDPVSWGHTTGAPSQQGAAFEVVDHCRHDVLAWVEFLAKRGLSRICLLGHSLGAVKAVYSQALDPHDSIQCVAAISPPRLSHSAFQNSAHSSVFFADLATARQHVQASQPEALFHASFPVPFLVSAAAYLDKYGPEERYNILRFLDRIDCPLLISYAQRELESGSIAFAGMPEATASVANDLTVVTIAEADHFYRGVCDSLADELTTWLRTRIGPG